LHDPNSGVLRLVGGEGFPESGGAPISGRRKVGASGGAGVGAGAVESAAARRRRAVASENRASAALDLEDARLVFALRVAERLEGGRAAILTPESRGRLMSLSERMGLAPFDASLVIAIVQDAARRGETADDPLTAGRLTLVRPAGRAARRTARDAVESLVVPAAAAVVLALVLITALIGLVL